MSFLPPGFLPSGYFPEGYLPGSETGSAAVIYVPPHRTVRISAHKVGPKVLRWAGSKTPSEPSRYRLDFTEEVELRWVRRIFSAGERISVGGYDAEALNAGLPGWREPRWPLVLGRDVPDGSLTWRIVEPSSASLVEVKEITWHAPEGIQVEEQKDGQLSTSAVLTGGEPGLVTVVIKVRYASGEGFDQPCQLLIE